jgi:poly(3-hydroxybutyrate) depolymerase
MIMFTTLQEFIRFIGAENLHVILVCQPTVPTLRAISINGFCGREDSRLNDH